MKKILIILVLFINTQSFAKYEDKYNITKEVIDKRLIAREELSVEFKTTKISTKYQHFVVLEAKYMGNEGEFKKGFKELYYSLVENGIKNVKNDKSGKKSIVKQTQDEFVSIDKTLSPIEFYTGIYIINNSIVTVSTGAGSEEPILSEISIFEYLVVNSLEGMEYQLAGRALSKLLTNKPK